MKRSNQKGVALLMTLILVLVISVMAASMMFLAQSETLSSVNYRLMTQARYGAEAGLHAAANYLTNAATGYPGIGTSDPISAYNINVSPVTAGGNPVVLSSLSGVTANYPVTAVKTAFASASNNSLSVGPNTVNYTASAQLLSMKTFLQCGNAQPLTSQLWKVISHGDIGGLRNAEVEVSALVESHIVPCYNFAAFATSSGCGAIDWSGGGPIDSYDSSTASGGTVSVDAYDGNIGSNGNANLAPHTSITGNFSSPETGVGACSSGNAISGATPSTISQYVSDCQTSATSCGTTYEVQLPQTVQVATPVTSYPTGVVESTLTSPSGNVSPNNCAGAATGCYGDITNSITLQPYVNGTTCSAATYYINTISLNGSRTLSVAPCPVGTTNAGSYQPIIVNIADVNNSGSPISIGGGSVANASLNPAFLQIQYAGTGTINLHGGSTAAAVVYAPNAPVTLNGANSAWYGALMVSTLTLNGNGASIHYDRRLSNNLATLGNWTMDTFTWSKY
jgi:PilX N-terminal